MSVLAWIVVGLLAGGAARKVVGAEKRGVLGTLVVGVIGALIGGALFNAAGSDGITHFGIWSLLVAFIGACLLLLVLQAVEGRAGR